MTSKWFVPKEFSQTQKRLLKLAQKHCFEYDDLFWFSSSGSTSDGGIKFFAHTLEGLTASAEAVCEHLEITTKDVILNPLPLYHVGGFGTWLRSQVANCDWIDISEEKWSPKMFHQTLTQTKATLTSLVPTQVHDLVQLKLTPPQTLRAVLVGGGRISESLYLEARSLGWPLLPSYGMTEMGSTIAAARLESLKDKKKFPKAYLLNHINDIILDESGFRIQSKSSAVFEVKVNLDQVISLEFKTLRRGMLIDDDVKLNENTRELKVVGRKSRVVKIKGELVSLDALEKAFSQICADLKLNEAFIITANLHERDENELVLNVESNQNFLRWKKALDDFNSKGSVWIARVEFVEKFPRTRLGKISSSI